jgi:1-acyl-sn-glycerol-3-phosphate acyltransferase
MITRLFALIFRLKGWKIVGTIPTDIKKAVIIAAPHTSSWDFIFALALRRILKIKMHYLAKKELFKFPLRILLNNTGGIPVERSKRQSMTEQIIEKFNDSDELLIALSTEGTRKQVDKWKSGFYFIALGAHVPILPGYLDYKKKEAGFGAPIYLTGDVEKDMLQLKAFYQDKTGKNPALFNVDSIRLD